jgi:hypothetical protein
MRGPIVYDQTASPDAAQLAHWAGILDLPVRHWQVIRRLLGRVVALGYDDKGTCDWVLKAGSGTRDHAANFAAAAEHACELEALARQSGATWLAAAPSCDWRRADDGEYALMALPYIVGDPLAAEHRLNSVEITSLGKDIGILCAVMSGLEDLGRLLPAPAFDRSSYRAHMTKRLEERLTALVERDGLELALAARLTADFGQRLEAAPLRAVFCHGELTAWHVLRRPEGQISLIDLETLGFDAAGDDLSVLVMRTWGLNAAPAVARSILAQVRNALPAAARDEFESELSWQWLFAAVRTRKESMSWRVRTEANSFWNWALRQP